ncbi:alpha/beta hydrolase [Arthrobacter monumenti]
MEVAGLECHIHSSASPPRTEGLPAFVLIHGMGMSHRYLHRLHNVLADVGDTYSIDLPGFGSTRTPDSRLSMSDYAGLLAKVLYGLGVSNAVLVGHSMGAQPVVELAIEQPELASHLILIGPAVDSARRSASEQALALFYNALMESPSLTGRQLLDLMRCGPRWFHRELPVVMTYPLEDRLSEVDQPVLVVRGEYDPVALPLWSQRLADGAKNGRLLEIPGHAHGVQHTAPEDVAAGIRKFLEIEHPPTGRGIQTSGMSSMTSAGSRL